MRFFADAAWTGFSGALAFYLGFGLLNKLLMFMGVKATIAPAFRSALFSSRKTLTIIFETVSLLTSAACLLSPDFGSLERWLFKSIRISEKGFGLLRDSLGLMAI